MNETAPSKEAQLVEKMVQEECLRIFYTVPAHERYTYLLKQISRYSHLPALDMDRSAEILEGIEQVDDLDIFTERFFNATKPIMDHIMRDPKSHQDQMREDALDDPKTEKIMVNELLYYHLDGKHNMHLHVFPNKFTTNSEKLHLMREGLAALVEILQNNVEIKKIYATSWIVEKNPKLMQMLGFTVTGEPRKSSREHSKRSSDVDQEEWQAHITREDFLAKYK